MSTSPLSELRLRRAEAAVAAAVAVLNVELQNLRPLPKHPRCCPSPDLRHVTRGLAQICAVVPAYRSGSGMTTGYTDGWDDMSETGSIADYIHCESCTRRWAVPDDLAWG